MLGIFIALFSILGWFLWTKSYYQVRDGYAMLRSGWGKEEVYFKGSFLAYPIFHKVEELDIREKRIHIQQTGPTSVFCKDNIRANIQLTFFVQIRASKWDVLKVAQRIGSEKAAQKETLHNLFAAKFQEAVKTTLCSTFDYEFLFNNQEKFKRQLFHLLRDDLGEYQLNRINIASLRYLPLDEYDIDHHILDAAGYKNLQKLLDQNKKIL